jgi:hypothetical protein
VKRDAGNMFFVFPQVFCKNFNFFYVFILFWYIGYIYISMYFQVKKGFFILNCKLRRQGLHELKVLGKNYIKKHGCTFLSMAN